MELDYHVCFSSLHTYYNHIAHPLTKNVPVRGTRAAKKPGSLEIEDPPQGLSIILLTNQELVQQAKEEVLAVMGAYCERQIASNRRFFINLPFPLNGDREDDTPLFPFAAEQGMRITRME